MTRGCSSVKTATYISIARKNATLPAIGAHLIA